jgi:hypothetical protein
MYYEFFIYGPTKKALEDVRDALVGAFEFDPASTLLRRSLHPWNEDLARRLLGFFGSHRRDDWLMTITGPEINREYVKGLADKYGGFCDGGGYDFGYDPTEHYSDEQIDRHTEQWQRQIDEANAAHLASLTEEQRDEYLLALEELSKGLGDESE